MLYTFFSIFESKISTRPIQNVMFDRNKYNLASKTFKILPYVNQTNWS